MGGRTTLHLPTLKGVAHQLRMKDQNLIGVTFLGFRVFRLLILLFYYCRLSITYGSDTVRETVRETGLTIVE